MISIGGGGSNLGYVNRWSKIVLFSLGVGMAGCKAGRTVSLAPGAKENKIEQAEVALEIARLGNVENLVAAFQDATNESADGFLYNKEFSQLLRIRRGASLIGWSTSTEPDAVGWSYHGKIRGTNAPDSAAILSGDPSMAVDPKNPANVYIAAMMVSNSLWNKFVKGDVAGDEEDELSASSISVSMNGFCVARSTDAGETFKSIKCVETSSLTFQSVDLTSVAVDAKGCVWVAFTDVAQGPFFGRLYRSRPSATSGICADWSQMEEVTPLGSFLAEDGSDVGVYANEAFPKVKSDHQGNVYFSTFDNDPQNSLGLLVIRKYDVANERWNWAIMPSPICMEGIRFPTGNKDLNKFFLPSGAHVRSAFPYDFAVGLDETDVPDMRIAIHTQNNIPEGIGSQRIIQAFSRQATPDGLCSPATGWNEPAPPAILAGFSAFQPVVTVRHGGRNGSEWFIGYLTNFDITDPTKDSLRVEGRRLAFFQQNVGGVEQYIPIQNIPVYFTPQNSRVCPTTGGYWGDYFGLAFHRTITGSMKLTSAFSFSGVGPQPCELQSPLRAIPLTVESATF